MARKHVVYLSAAILIALMPVLGWAGNGHGHGYNQTTAKPSTTTLESSSTTVDQGGFPNALAVDPFGRPCTAYFNGAELKFAVFDGSGWQIQSVGRVGGDTGATVVGLAIDAQGRPGIAYFVPYEGGVTVNRLGFATYDGAVWKTEAFDRDAFQPSIAHSPLTGFAIAYVKFDGFGRVLNLAENAGIGWHVVTVDSSARSSGVSGGIRGPAVAVDGLGNVGISYGLDIPNIAKQVRYAYRSNGSWSIRTVVSSDLGMATSLSYDASGRPCIAFWGALTRTLNLARFDGAAWQNSRLPWNGSGSAGQLSLAIDGSGAAYLSVYDTGSGDLHLVHGSSGQYSSQMIASTGTVGQSNSLRVNKATGQKGVTFSDETMRVLKFVTMY